MLLLDESGVVAAEVEGFSAEGSFGTLGKELVDFLSWMMGYSL